MAVGTITFVFPTGETHIYRADSVFRGIQVHGLRPILAIVEGDIPSSVIYKDIPAVLAKGAKIWDGVYGGFVN